MIFGKHKHQNESVWDHAPPWAVELGALILFNQETTMAAIDDLKETAANIAAAVTALTAAVDAKLTTHTVSDADIAAVTAALGPAVDAINAAVTKLTAPPAA